MEINIDNTIRLTGGNGIEDGILKCSISPDFPPYEYIENVMVVGIDAEVIKAVAKKLGVAAEFENLSFDAVVIDGKSAKEYEDKYENIKIIDEPLKSDEFCIVVNLNNNELKNKINEAIKELKESGELQTIIDKYFVVD